MVVRVAVCLAGLHSFLPLHKISPHLYVEVGLSYDTITGAVVSGGSLV